MSSSGFLFSFSLFALLMPSAIFGETTAPQTLPQIKDVAKNLGVQVTRAMMMRSDYGKSKDGRLMMYTVLMGQPSVLVVTDVLSAEVVSTHPLPSTSGAWSVLAAGNGDVYIGAYNAGLVYRYSPDTDSVENLGRPFKTNEAVLYPTTEGPDGKIYGGTYPSGHIYEFDPAKSQFRDLGNLTTTTAREKWPRVTVYDPATKNLYIGYGNQPQLVEFNLETSQTRELLSPAYEKITSVYDLNVEGGRLFCRKETSEPYEYFVLDQESGQTIPVKNADTGEVHNTFANASRGMSPKSPVANKMYYIPRNLMFSEYDLDTNTVRSLGIKFPSVATGYHWAELGEADWPGWTLIGTVGNSGELFRYNVETGRHDVRPVNYPGQPINIHDIETGPDGKIYSGGYLAGNMGIYDPATGKVEHMSGSGQTEGLVFLGRSLYMGVYPNGRIFEYKIDLPWNARPFISAQDTSTPQNPVEIFTMETNPEIPGYTEQDRPFAMAASEDMKKVFVGTVPKNGRLGGALAIWDLTTSDSPQIMWNVVPDQSIVGMAYHNGVVYGGTSIYGGLGSTPTETEGKLFAWDVAENKMLYTITPVPSKPAVTQLLTRPDGTIWGLAGSTLFIFDPEKREVVFTTEVVDGAGARWREGSLVNGVDGNVYGTMSYVLFKVDPETRQVTRLATGADKVASDFDGSLYTFGDPKTELYQIDSELLEKLGQ